jgi:hypothetical protein
MRPSAVERECTLPCIWHTHTEAGTHPRAKCAAALIYSLFLKLEDGPGSSVLSRTDTRHWCLSRRVMLPRPNEANCGAGQPRHSATEGSLWHPRGRQRRGPGGLVANPGHVRVEA